MASLAQFLQCRRGAVFIEAAFALPMLMATIIGIIQISLYLDQRGSMERASSSVISLAAQAGDLPADAGDWTAMRQGWAAAFQAAAGLEPGDDYGVLLCEVRLDASGVALVDGSSDCSAARQWWSQEEGAVSGMSGEAGIDKIEASAGAGLERRYLLLEAALKVYGLGNIVPGLNGISIRRIVELPPAP